LTDKIVLFDGWCNLCGRTIRFIQKYDRSHQLSFIPIQSEKGQELIESFQLDPIETDSVIYFEKDISYIKSEAFFRIANNLGGFFKMMTVFRILPKKFSDWIYDLIAKNRYNWFGKKEVCMIISRQTKQPETLSGPSSKLH